MAALASTLDPTEELRYRLLGSFLDFTRYFFKCRTGQKFELSQPTSRESHYLTIAKSLTACHRGDANRLIINIPPRYGKTEMVIHWIAWCLARNPRCEFIYVSYSSRLASRQTATIRNIVTHPEYRRLFGIELANDQNAKDNFQTKEGGVVYAAGASGSVTGMGAGIKGREDFGGAIVIDDILKPSEATSDVQRKSINKWYFNTLISRQNNGDKTPIVFIGQRLHEDDLGGNLIDGFDGHKWDTVVIPALSENGHALLPSLHSEEDLHRMAKTMPYEFAAQYQQNPQPAGGGIFKREWFAELEENPDVLATFITADTAETDKTYNDATVFSFWGLYKIKINEVETELYGLHWLDCHELWCEPKDLKAEFLSFWSDCMRFNVKPKAAYIEKKSTGTTLISILKDIQGLNIIEIERNRSSGSKSQRFLECQPYIASKQVSLLEGAKHAAHCIDHMVKITANDSHRHDDIADTLADAVKIALIDKSIYFATEKPKTNDSRFRQRYQSSRWY